MPFQSILNSIFSKFSGGACPRIPLEGLKNFFLAAAWLKLFFRIDLPPPPKQKILDRTLAGYFTTVPIPPNAHMISPKETMIPPSPPPPRMRCILLIQGVFLVVLEIGHAVQITIYSFECVHSRIFISCLSI